MLLQRIGGRVAYGSRIEMHVVPNAASICIGSTA